MDRNVIHAINFKSLLRNIISKKGLIVMQTVNVMSPFISSIKVQLNAFHLKKLMAIDEFDFSKVSEKTQQDLLSEGTKVEHAYFEKGILALKQYYAVALFDPKNMHAVSNVVDPFWHNHILFTKDYVEFCDQIYGHYVHHTPLNKSDDAAVRKVQTLYEYTLDIYSKLFNRIDAFFWPPVAKDNLVCTHMEIISPEVRENSLFPVNKKLQADIILN